VPTLIFVEKSGARRAVAAIAGESLMVAATRAGVDGIIGECGGQAMCATCHVYVRPEYLDGLPGIGDDEEEMLDCTTEERDGDRSRLGCQLKAGEAFDSIEVDLPASQI
jgi:2Fe-2S ferredoxin